MPNGEILFFSKMKGVGTLESESGEKYFFKTETEVQEGDKVIFEYITSNLKGLLGINNVMAEIIKQKEY